VDAELVAIPGLGTLTVGGLAGGDAQDLYSSNTVA